MAIYRIALVYDRRMNKEYGVATRPMFTRNYVNTDSNDRLRSQYRVHETVVLDLKNRESRGIIAEREISGGRAFLRYSEVVYYDPRFANSRIVHVARVIYRND